VAETVSAGGESPHHAV